MILRVQKYRNIGQKVTATILAAGAGVGSGSRQPEAYPLPKTGELVTVVIVDPKGKNRLFVKHPAVERPGYVLNVDKYQGDRSVGASVQLVVHMVSLNGKDIQFRPPH